MEHFVQGTLDQFHMNNLEASVAGFTNATDLRNFAATWGIQESPCVRLRVFQLENPEYDEEFVGEQLDAILDNLGGPPTPHNDAEMDDIARACVEDNWDPEHVIIRTWEEEMADLARVCLEDQWDGSGSSNPPTPTTQDPRPGPSRESVVQTGRGPQPYEIRQKRVRTFASTKATEKVYTVKANDQWQGRDLKDLHDDLHSMFDDVLRRARDDLAGNDLGRVVINHAALNDPIVVPLQPWDLLDANTVMDVVEKVLNSQEELPVDDSFEVTIGCIDLPKGGANRKYVTSTSGDFNSLHLKKSVVYIENSDQLCMARAIAVCWAKINRCTPEEWMDITRNRNGKNNTELALEHRKVPVTFYDNIIHKKRPEQKNLAVSICQLAGVSTDRPMSLNDIDAFERVLGMRILVLSATLGNKFVRVGSNEYPDLPQAFLYLVDDDHFHAVNTITGFFSRNYFCDSCLKAFDHFEDHRCETTCIVCKSLDCPKTKTEITCAECNMTCRSRACFDLHKHQPKSKKGNGVSSCEKYWKCTTCYKVINRIRRDLTKKIHVCGEWLCKSCDVMVIGDHRCYLKSTTPEYRPPKYIFFDFECTQDETSECDRGYLPGPLCDECKDPCSKCRTCQNCVRKICGRQIHSPNYAVSHKVCGACINDTDLDGTSKCRKCGTRCSECDQTNKKGIFVKGPCEDTCGFREKIFSGPNTLKMFGNWLFDSQNKGFTALAHNMSGYDGVFILQYLLDNSVRPDKIIYNGSKIMYMSVQRGLDMRLIDSLKFLPMRLSALPKAFDLSELRKGYFPHYFNRACNQDYVGPYPDPKYYGAAYMGKSERDSFLKWYSEQKDAVFDFRVQMREYCRSDVDILRRACLKYRKLLMEVTDGKIDPFWYITIASVCMGIFKTVFLREGYEVTLLRPDGLVTELLRAEKTVEGLKVLYEGEWTNLDVLLDRKYSVQTKKWTDSPIARVPSEGYVKQDQYSMESIQWLEWLRHDAELNGRRLNIRHALNGGEHLVSGTKYRLDGYCAETNTAYEFNGCLYHGCQKCFPGDRGTVKHPRTNQSVEELLALTNKKKFCLTRKGFKYEDVWECDFQKSLRENPEMKAFVDSLDLQSRLDPRDSFFGGRTNAVRLHYEAGASETIKYVDFTSLYPWTNKTSRYPLGHPEIIHEDFGPISDYFGIVKTKVLPPRGLLHPVLPYKSMGKLKFPLCRTCADAEQMTPCNHDDDERAIKGTWCTPELEKAKEMGYTILKLYEVYHWSETTQYDPATKNGGLFAEYINAFLKYKQEASDWPAWCKTEDDKTKYVGDYFEREGVSLNPSNIKKNPGLRSLAKLCLNSFWGKFGQRLNLKQSSIFHRSEADAFFAELTDPSKEVKDFHIVSDDFIMLEWSHKTDFVPDDDKTNIFLATFTTCWARLKLYSVLERVEDRVLYMDTDSVVYVSRSGQYDPPLGDFLGDLTDELDGDDIVEFVSGGPKNYAYRTKTGKQVCKVRGFTLNFTNQLLINFDTVKELVTNIDPAKPETFRPLKRKLERESDVPAKKTKFVVLTNPSKISRNKDATVLYNKPEKKKYRLVYTKRVIQEDLGTLPYGY